MTLTCGFGLDLCVVCGNAYTEHRQHTDIHRSPKTLPTGNFGEMFQALGFGLLLPLISYYAQAATGVLCRRLCSYPNYCCNSPPPLPSRPASAHHTNSSGSGACPPVSLMLIPVTALLVSAPLHHRLEDSFFHQCVFKKIGGIRHPRVPEHLRRLDPRRHGARLRRHPPHRRFRPADS